MTDIVERLRSNEPLPVCPFDRLSPHYWTIPDDKPCPICGQENTSEGPDKCRGADTRVMKEAADEIERLRATIVDLRSLPSEPLQCLRCGTVDAFGPVLEGK